MSIQQLRERKNSLNKQANHILAEMGSATWPKEKQTEFDNLVDESERLTAQITAHQRMLDADAEREFKDAKPVGDGRPKSEIREGFELFLRKSHKELSQEEAVKVRNAMSTTTGSEGGFTVQTEVAKTLIESLKSFGAMRRLASQITTSSGTPLGYPTTDGTAEEGEIVAENAAAGNADVSFGTRPLNVFKFSSKVVTVPLELLQDSSIDVEALVFGRLRTRIGRIQNKNFSIGVGTTEPLGIVTAATVGKTGTTGQVATIVYDDLVDMVDSLDVAYLEDPEGQDLPAGTPAAAPGWMFAQPMRRVVRKIKDTAGRPIWTPSYDEGLAAATPDLLLGHPVTINNNMAAPGANAKSLGFGNVNRYMVRDAMQVTFYRFDDSAFAIKGQVGFLAFCRAGGNLMDTSAFKVYQHPAT